MPQETLSLTILFADIAKSTRLYETLGDTIAKNIISTCLSLFSDITIKHHGTVIKTIGDEIMCTFPTADNAVEAGTDMHKALEHMPVIDKLGCTTPNIYVGIHEGPVIREGGDVFGDAVNVAARMVSIAKQRQIITTKQTTEALSPENKSSVQKTDKTTIKGKTGEHSIYEVIWEQHDVTVMLDDDSFDTQQIKCHLELKFGDQILKVDESRPSASLGRQIHNDIAVNNNRISRSHARIEYRRGKFFLIDQSTNGTFVLMQGKKRISLKRDEAHLLGDGLIRLGQEVDPDSPETIHFAIKL